jgi:trans-2,3-dihydro-3-hydroxyanthranilate isomerase
VRIPFRLVDVFTDRPLAGNQLCVVPDPVALPTRAMQAIAGEIGFSETTFVSEAAGHRYAMRIFTPAAEMPFAGHPSLGTAFVLASEGRVQTPMTQVVEAGEFQLTVDVEAGRARMRQHPPEFGPPIEDLAALARAVGLVPGDFAPDRPIRPVSTGIAHLIAEVRDDETLSRAEPDRRALGPVLRAMSSDGLYLFAHTGASEATARLFTADLGIVEDPATGSAAGPLGAHLVDTGAVASGRITIFQGAAMGRPSTLEVDVERDCDRWDVFVGGGVSIVGHGEFDLVDAALA